VLIELFLPTQNAQAVQALWTAEPDWWLPALWICEFRHVHLTFLRAGRLDLNTALDNLSDAEKTFPPQTVTIDSAEALRLAAQHGCSSYEAEFVVLAQQLACPLLTFDQKVLQLFPNLAVRAVAEPWRSRGGAVAEPWRERHHHKPDPILLSRPGSHRNRIKRAPQVPTSTSLQIRRGRAGLAP
jgi:predicted nucleic acid-binding protein